MNLNRCQRSPDLVGTAQANRRCVDPRYRDRFDDKFIELVNLLAELEVAVAIHPCGGIQNIDGQGAWQRDRAFL